MNIERIKENVDPFDFPLKLFRRKNDITLTRSNPTIKVWFDSTRRGNRTVCLGKTKREDEKILYISKITIRA